MKTFKTLLLALLCTVSMQSFAGYSFKLLKPTGINQSFAHGLSRDGTMVVGEYQSVVNGNRRAFKWTAASGFVDLGYIKSNFKDVSAQACSNDGSTIVGYENEADNSSSAFRFKGAMYKIGALDPSGANAWDVSGDGSVVAGVTYVPHGQYHGFRYTVATGMQDLKALNSDPFSQGYGISADGKIIVGFSAPGGDIAHACFWNANNALTLLSPPNGYGFSEARATNLDGTIIFGSAGPDYNGAKVCRWINGVGTMLGLPPQMSYATPSGVSDDGQIASMSSIWGFLWSAQTLYVNVQQRLAANGVTVPGYTIGGIEDISADGKTICGNAYANGKSYAFIATLDMPPAISSISYSPSTVKGGAQTYGKVTLAAPATEDQTVTLANPNSSIATMPASIKIFKGKTSTSFVIQTKPQTVTKHLTVTASQNLDSAKAVLTVTP